MNIVIEGPDNSGKSTLLHFLSDRLSMPTARGSVGPPLHHKDWMNGFNIAMAMDGVIFDRHAAISEPIYGPLIRGLDHSDPICIRRFYATKPLLIYCVSRGLAGHKADHARDTAEHLRRLEKRHGDICRLYSLWAMNSAHIIYRIGDDKELVARMCRAAGNASWASDKSRKFCDHGRPIDDNCPKCDDELIEVCRQREREWGF